MQAPKTPAERLVLAAQLAAPNVAARHALVQSQIGKPHVYIIATSDCSIGAQWVGGFLGPKVGQALCGPALITLPVERFAAVLPEADRSTIMAEFDGAGPDDLRICFAINGDEMTLRVINAPTLEQHGVRAVVACVEWPEEHVTAHEVCGTCTAIMAEDPGRHSRGCARRADYEPDDATSDAAL